MILSGNVKLINQFSNPHSVAIVDSQSLNREGLEAARLAVSTANAKQNLNQKPRGDFLDGHWV